MQAIWRAEIRGTFKTAGRGPLTTWARGNKYTWRARGTTIKARAQSCSAEPVRANLVGSFRNITSGPRDIY